MTSKMWRPLFSLLLIVLFAISISCRREQEPPTPTALPPQPTPTATPVGFGLVPLEDDSAIAPQVIGRNPAPGEELGLDGHLEIYFDQPMNQAATAQAFQLLDGNDAPIAGAITWPQPRILRFQAQAPLKPDSHYRAKLAPTTASALGANLLEGLTLEFGTIGDILVSQVSPAPDTEGINPDSTVTVIFNRPVVPLLTAAEKARLASPLTLEPETPGEGEWVNTSVYIFRPNSPLINGQTYTLSIDQATVNSLSATGAVMAEDYTSRFTVAPPTFGFLNLPGLSDYPYDNFENLPLEQSFQLGFPQAMDPETTQSAVSLTAQGGGAAPLTFHWDDDYRTVTITPTTRLALATLYTLKVDVTAQSAHGGRLDKPFLWRAATVAAPAIVNTFPADGETPGYFPNAFTIYFASPMDVATLKGKVTITPAIRGDVNGEYGPWDNSLTFYGLSPSTAYTVRIAAGMADVYGNPIAQETVVRFNTPLREPLAAFNFPGPLSLYRQGGDNTAWVSYRNVDSVEVQLYRLTLAELDDVYTYRIDRNNFTPPAGQRLWEEKRAVSAESNVLAYTSFTLNDLTPGLYYLTLDAPQAPHYNQQRYLNTQPIVLANANLTLKTTASEALIWLTDLDSGQPLAGVKVTLYDNTQETVFSGVTDSAGLIYQAGLTLSADWEHLYYAITDDPAIFGAAINNWEQGVEPYNFGINTDYYLQPNAPAAYVYTDRPLYRPGQPVHIKGVVRLNDDLRYNLPDFESVSVQVSSYTDTIFDDTLLLSPYGSFEIPLELDNEATLGTYSISVQVMQDTGPVYVGGGYFDVAEYRKPTFQVDVQATPTHVSAGDTIDASGAARFFSGGAVVNSRVDWYVSAQDYFFSPGGDYNRYQFYDVSQESAYYNDSFYQPIEFIAGGDTLTDADGQFHFQIPAELGEAGRSRQLTVEATVTDLAQNAVSGRTSVVVHAGQVYPGVRPTTYVGVAGQPTSFDLVALTWDAEPKPGQTVAVNIVERRWLSVQEENELGQTIWRSEVQEKGVLTTTITLGADGTGLVTFTPVAGGVYKAYVRAADAQGRENLASAYVWVADEAYVAWQQSNDHAFTLVADAESYRPGDSAEILIASPFQGEATALVTVERGHIKTYAVVPLTNNSTLYSLPITADMAPNVFVSALIIKGIDDFNPYPDFKIGFTQFTVERSRQALTVDIQPNTTQAGPGDDVTYSVRVTDAAGQPAQAELSLALVDLSVLSLANPNAPAALDFFYSTRWLSVRTSLLLGLSMDGFNQELQEQFKGGGGGGGESGIINIRQEFPDTAYWQGQLTTDANGQAEVTVTLPDNLTTWRMDVRAVTQDTRVGQATSDLVSTLPVLISPNTPRFFIPDDRASVSALVHNNTDQPQAVTARLEAEGATLADAAEKVVTVPAHQQALVTWDVVINQVERVDMVFSAQSPDYADASRPPLGTLDGQGIPVYRYEVPETVGTSGQLLDGGVAVESIGLPILPGFTLTEGETTVTVAPSLAAAMTDGLDYLAHYPYECTEQIVSKFLPNVITTRALKAAGLSDPQLEADLADQVAVALQKLYARQAENGGWPWWEGDQTDTLITAYVVWGLHEARNAGYTVSADAVTRGAGYLRQHLREVEQLNGRFKLNRQAFLLYVLAKVDVAPTNFLNTLYESRASLDLDAQAWLAQALALTDAQDPRVATLLADVISRAAVSATGVSWEETERDYWNWGSDTRTTAIVVNMLAQLDPQNPLLANGVRWLMAHRTDGRWLSTQETAWSLLALADWLTVSGELQPDFQYEVALNGKLLGSATATPATVRERLELRVPITDLFTDQLNRLAIGRSDGPGNLYYTTHLRVSLPVDQVSALNQGIIVSRQYFDPADRATPITEVEQGQTFLARLTIVAPATLHYALIEDWLPAGLEAVDTSLLTSQQVGAPSLYETPLSIEDYFTRGWGWWYFNHVELRDEKVVISADFLPAGTYEYVYLVRAATPGQYHVIPPSAQEFYFPEVYGRGDGMLFTIRPKN